LAIFFQDINPLGVDKLKNGGDPVSSVP